jgi:hypothetical protein
VVFTLSLGILACGDDATPPPPSPDEVEGTLLENLPDSRTVMLGIQPFPHDMTDEAVGAAYEFVQGHADLFFYHLDNGIPWPEALAGDLYHPNFMADIEDMAAGRISGQKFYLAITPNAPERDQIAQYRGEEEGMDLPSDWQDKTFDDPDVIAAYLNHARFMIDTLGPDYFAYGIEVTCDFSGVDDPALAQFLVLAAEVYPTLKQDYPDLPIFLTICTGSFQHDDINVLFELSKQVLEYSDYVAISTYPYWIVPGMKIKEANPDNLPRDWFAQWTNLAPEKPFAVAETAYPAENLKMTPVFFWRVNIEANENWQADYVAFMLEELNNLDAVFVAWFIPRDYDALYDWITEQVGEVEFFKTWRDTGFLDGEGVERPSLAVWDAWLGLPHTDD